MADLEIALAVVLTVLAIAILAILIARWTRRRHNEARVCRYTSEQSAGLLDHEDGISRGRHKRGRGSRCSFSSDSGPTGVSVGGKSVSHHSLGPTGVSVGGKSVSHHSLGLCRSNPAESQEPQTICQGTPSKTRSTKSLSEPLTGNAGEISGTIGPIMQFSAPIPGATGPIKLSQKTFLQTPGPIVQCMDSSESCSPEESTAVIPVDICCQPPSLKPSCFQQLSLKPSCCQPCNPCNQCGACQPALMPSCQPESTVPILLTQRTGTKRGPPIILKKQSDCKGQMIRHGGSVTFQDPCGNALKCCKAWRRCQCEYCCPKRREQPIWCEEAAPSTPPQQQQQQQQHPPRRQDSQVRFEQRSESELGTQPICYEEPFLFRRLESLIRKNQDGIVIKQNEGGFLIQKAGEPHREPQREPQREPHRESHREPPREPPPERRQSGKRSSKKSSQPQETDSDSSAPQNAEADSPAPADQAPSEENLSEGDGKKRKKEKKKKKKKDG